MDVGKTPFAGQTIDCVSPAHQNQDGNGQTKMGWVNTKNLKKRNPEALYLAYCFRERTFFTERTGNNPGRPKSA